MELSQADKRYRMIYVDSGDLIGRGDRISEVWIRLSLNYEWWFGNYKRGRRR